MRMVDIDFDRTYSWIDVCLADNGSVRRYRVTGPLPFHSLQTEVVEPALMERGDVEVHAEGGRTVMTCNGRTIFDGCTVSPVSAG